MPAMNRPRWLILICCVYLAVITGLVSVGLLAPNMDFAAIVVLYVPILSLILLGFLSEGIIRISRYSGK